MDRRRSTGQQFLAPRTKRGSPTGTPSIRRVCVLALVVLACTLSGAAAAGDPVGRIAFASDRGGNFDVYTMGSDGSAVTQLTSSSAADTEPDWMSGGSKLAFVSDRDGTTRSTS